MARAQPKLLTSVETPPNASAVAATSASMSSFEVTSQAMPRQRPPVTASISAAVSSALSP